MGYDDSMNLKWHRLILIALILFTHNLWAQRFYHFNIIVNEFTQSISTQLSKDHFFETQIPLISNSKSDIWRLNVSSPDLPSKMILSFIRNDQIVIKIQYKDPLFSALDFETLGLEELILYLNNEDQMIKKNIVRALASSLRLDIFQKMLTDLQTREWIGLEEDYLIGLQKMYQEFPGTAARNLIQLAHDSKKFDEIKTTILLMGLGLKNPDEIRRMKELIKNDESVHPFIIELLSTSPQNTVFQYFSR
jgi:hypothetical protein